MMMMIMMIIMIITQIIAMKQIISISLYIHLLLLLLPAPSNPPFGQGGLRSNSAGRIDCYCYCHCYGCNIQWP